MFSLAFIRQVMKDNQGKPTIMREVNYVFEKIAKQRGFYSDALIDRISEEGSAAHVDEVPDDVKQVFVCAHDITPYWHMKMQAAFQRHCDSSISKTINFPHDATAEDVRAIYELAIDEDVKGVTVYRDGCRDVQPMALTKSGDTHKQSTTIAVAGAESSEASDRELLAVPNSSDADLKPVRLPEIMSCLRIRQMTPFGNMHVKVSVEPLSGREREVFAQLGKGGDVANSDLEAICRILSLWLRSNGSLNLALKQLEGIGSSLSVPTKDGRIMSRADGLAKALQRYLDAKQQFGLHALLLGTAHMSTEDAAAAMSAAAGSMAAKTARTPTAARNGASSYKIKCPACTGALAFQEGCVKCHSCGFSQC
jgi:ribonucleoside-diphosphate reductase alpha chain